MYKTVKMADLESVVVKRRITYSNSNDKLLECSKTDESYLVKVAFPRLRFISRGSIVSDLSFEGIGSDKPFLAIIILKLNREIMQIKVRMFLKSR